jgi:hypothetical protein
MQIASAIETELADKQFQLATQKDSGGWGLNKVDRVHALVETLLRKKVIQYAMIWINLMTRIEKTSVMST